MNVIDVGAVGGCAKSTCQLKAVSCLPSRVTLVPLAGLSSVTVGAVPSADAVEAVARAATRTRTIRRARDKTLTSWVGGGGRPPSCLSVASRMRGSLDLGIRRIHPMELIHTCYRITDIDRSVGFYEALGFEERGRFPIRDEAINVFMGLPGDGNRLELTYNFAVDPYEIGTGYGHIAVTVDDLGQTLVALKEQGIEPEREPYRVREGSSLICFV